MYIHLHALRKLGSFWIIYIEGLITKKKIIMLLLIKMRKWPNRQDFLFYDNSLLYIVPHTLNIY